MVDIKDKKSETFDIPVEVEEVNSKKNNVESPATGDSGSDYLETLQRLQADFDNFRKHCKKEKEELSEYVLGNVILQLLPILDDFERLLKTDTDNSDIKHGAHLIYKNLITVFKQFGLKSFTDSGKKFDPNIHEALSAGETSKENEGKILETWLQGYRLKNRLLRPAKVIVGKAKIENSGSKT